VFYTLDPSSVVLTKQSIAMEGALRPGQRRESEREKMETVSGDVERGERAED
jgi:hypothetical protein